MPAEELRRELASLSTTVHVSDVEAGVVNIDLISVPAELRGRGCATDALTRITGWADRTGTTLTLTATYSLGSNVKRLLGLYKRHGFTPTVLLPTREVQMRRTPTGETPSCPAIGFFGPPRTSTA